MPNDVTNPIIIWTALPNGLSGGGKAQLSVLVSPRLLQGGNPLTLGAFGDFKNWPVIVNGLEFDAYFNNQTQPFPMQKQFDSEAGPVASYFSGDNSRPAIPVQ